MEIGAPVGELEAKLGPPMYPPFRVARRSVLREWLYGNVAFLVKDDVVVLIQIDVHGHQPSFVEAGAMEAWQMDEWRDYAREQLLTESKILDVSYFDDSHRRIGVGDVGGVGWVELR